MPIHDALQQTLTLILAGGQGERLMPLTAERAKPAVSFGGIYRIVDFTISNSINSGLRHIYVLTQYRSRSLEDHLRLGWNFLPRRLAQFIAPLPPQRATRETWYGGTADAVHQNLETIEAEGKKRVLILSGDHIYKMDYGRMLADHVERRADVTIGAIPVKCADARRFGVFETAADGSVTGFAEKPKQPKEMADRPGWSLASMGIYLFETAVLKKLLVADARRADSSHDFGKDVIPRAIVDHRVAAHRFVDENHKAEPYWRDIGTIDSFYEANLDLIAVEPQFNLYDHDWPIFTMQHNEPPAKTVFADPPGTGKRAEVLDSILSPGVVVSGGRVERSLLAYRCRVEEHAVVEDSILHAGVVVGPGAKVRRAIIDKWTHVPAGETIGHDLARDRRRFTVSEGGVVVVPMRYDFANAPT
ncbi:MAG: glucose-1-phosphate adenylyltransferase [Planctomycetes bacterium]|nr:glucose-1-phosphate adenylyltransferase [Planctomycetota bacterium]